MPAAPNTMLRHLAAHLRAPSQSSSLPCSSRGATERFDAAAKSERKAAAKIAVVGCGWWTTAHHLPDLSENPAAELIAVVEPIEERRVAVASKYGVAGFGGVEAMVRAGVKLDGVIVASAHVAHAENALACLRAGWHVLVEKPMTTTAEEAAGLLKAAAEHGVTISVNNTANFNAATDEAAALIADGTFGTVQHVVCTMAGDLADLFGSTGMDRASPHRGGDREEAVVYSPMASTWADPKRAGGYGWGQMSHSLAWAYEVSGLAPAQIFAFDGKSDAGVDYFDAATVRCTNGATMAVSGAANAVVGHGTRVEIFAEKGSLVYSNGAIIASLRATEAGAPSTDIPIPADESKARTMPLHGQPIGQVGVWRFVERCRGVASAESHNSADGYVGQRVVQTLQGIYTSARTGQVFFVS